jgi:hypothetical protein
MVATATVSSSPRRSRMVILRSRAWWPTALALALGAAIGACSDSTPPVPAPTGRYELSLVNDQPPPYPFFSSLMFQRHLVSGSIEFRGRGRLVEARGYQNMSYAGEPIAEVEPDTLAQAYRVSGTQLVVERTSSGGVVAYTDTGTVDAERVTLKVRDIGVQYPGVNLRLVFVRQP